MSWWLNPLTVARGNGIEAPQFIASDGFYGNLLSVDTEIVRSTREEQALVGSLTANTVTVGQAFGNFRGRFVGDFTGNVDAETLTVNRLLANVELQTPNVLVVTNRYGNVVASAIGVVDASSLKLGNLLVDPALVISDPTSSSSSELVNISSANVTITPPLYANLINANLIQVNSAFPSLSVVSLDANAAAVGELVVSGNLTVGGATSSSGGGISVPVLFGNVVGNLQGTSITAQTVTATTSVTTDELDANVIVTRRLVLPSGGDGVLSGRVGVRTDVLNNAIVDGDLVVKNGRIEGNGSAVFGFSGKANPDLEQRLSAFANSRRRMYVSTTGNDAHTGLSRDQAVRTVKEAARRAVFGTVIFVEAGVYSENNPIWLKENVALIGDGLRNTVLTARNPRIDFFHCSNNNYIQQLRFVDLRAPGFACAFPCSLTSVNVVDGSLTSPLGPLNDRVPVLFSPQAPNGYFAENKPPSNAVTITPDIIKTTVFALFEGIARIVESGPAASPPLESSTNPGGMSRVASLLEGNLAFFRAEVAAWLDSYGPTLTTQQRQFCLRDVGLLTGAVSQDLGEGRNVYSTGAGLKYYDGNTTILSAGTTAPTAFAIRYLGALAALAGSEVPIDLAGLQTFVPSLLNAPFQSTITQRSYKYKSVESSADVPAAASAIVEAYKLDLAGVRAGDGDRRPTDRIETLFSLFARPKQPVPSAATYPRTAALLRHNRAALLGFFADHVAASVNLSASQTQKCARDVGFVVDAVAADLENGGDAETRACAVKYADAPTTTDAARAIDAFEVLRFSIVGLVHSGRLVLPPSSQNTDPTARLQAFVHECFAKLIAGVNGTPLSNGTALNAGWNAGACAGLGAYASFLEAEMTAWLTANATIAVDTSKCIRDVRTIVLRLRGDLLRGTSTGIDGAVASYVAGAIAGTEKPQTVAAFGYLDGLCQKIVAGIPLTFTLTTPPPPPVSTTEIDPGAAPVVTSLLRGIATGLERGTFDASAFSFAARAQTGNLVNAAWAVQSRRPALIMAIPPMPDPKCARDVGYLVDAVTQDLVDGGIASSLRVLQAYAGNAIPSNEIAPSIQAINAIDAALNPLSRTGVDDAAAASNVAISLMDDIATYIQTPLPFATSGNGGGYGDAARRIDQNLGFLKAEVSAWTQRQYPSLAVDWSVCERDVGYLALAVSNDLKRGGTASSLAAAQKYYANAVPVLPNIELAPTVKAIKYLKCLTTLVIRNVPVTYQQLVGVDATLAGTVAYPIPAQLNTFQFSSSTDASDPALDGALLASNVMLRVVTAISAGNATVQAIPAANAYYHTALSLRAQIPALQAKAGTRLTALALTDVQKAKCLRDVAYTVNAVATDMTDGGSAACSNAALAFATNLPLGERSDAANVFTALANVIAYVPNVDSSPPPPARVTWTPDPQAGNVVLQLVQGVASVVESGPGAWPSVTNAGGYGRAADILERGLDFLREETAAYASTLVTLTDLQKAKCARDVGSIVRAVLSCLDAGGSAAVREAGNAYYQGVSSVLPTDQRAPTAAAIRYLGNVASSFAVSVVPSTFPASQTKTPPIPRDGILDNGTSSDSDVRRRIEGLAGAIAAYVTDGTAVPTDTFAPMPRAAFELLRNIRVIPSQLTVPNVLTTTQTAKCMRDAYYVVWAMASDLSGGTTTATATAAAAYANGILPVDQRQPTAEVLRQLGVIAGRLATSPPLPPVLPSSCPLVPTLVYALVDNVASVVGGNAWTPILTNPGGFVEAAADLRACTGFLASEVLAWITATYPSLLTGDQQTKCSRDVGYIVDAVANDLRVGGAYNSSVVAAVYTTGGTILPPSERSPTVEALRRLRDMAVLVSTKRLVPSTLSLAPQPPPSFLPATDLTDAGPIVTALVTDIAAVIETPNVAHTWSYASTANPGQLMRGAFGTLAARESAMDAVFNFVQTTYPSLNLSSPQQSKCKRDVGYIVRAIASDLAEGGCVYSKAAANAYVGGTVIATNERSPTAQAVRFLGNVLLSLGTVAVDPPLPDMLHVGVPASDKTLDFVKALLEYLVSSSNGLPLPLAGGADTRSAGLLVQNAAWVAAELGDSVKPVWTAIAGDLGDNGSERTRTLVTSLSSTVLRQLETYALAILQDRPVVPPVQYAVPQTWYDPSDTSKGAGDIVRAGMNILASSIADGQQRAVGLVDGGGYYRSAALLLSNTDFLAAEIGAWTDLATSLSGPQKTKCMRDVAYIVRAMASDLVTGGCVAFQAAADAYVGVSLSPNTAATAMAVRRLGAMMVAVLDEVPLTSRVLFERGNPTPEKAPMQTSVGQFVFDALPQKTKAKSPVGIVQSLMDLAISAILSPYSASPSGVQNPGGYGTAAYLLFESTNFLTDVVAGWVDVHAPSLSPSQRALCLRDVGYMVDAVRRDLLDGSAQWTAVAANAYAGGIPTSQTQTTSDALRVLKACMCCVISEIPVTAAQVRAFDPNAVLELPLPLAGQPFRRPVDTFANPEDTVSALVRSVMIPGVRGLVSRAVQNPGGAYASAATLRRSADLVGTAVQTWVSVNVSWLSPDQAAKCSRDVGYLVEALAVDLVDGGIIASLEAATAYGAGAAIPVIEQQPTVEALGVLETACLQALRDQTWTLPTSADPGDMAARLLGCAATVIAEGPTAGAWTSVASNPGGFVEAALAIRANRDFVRAEVADWVRANVPGLTTLQKSYCDRDVGYFADAVAADLVDGNSGATFRAAQAYFQGNASVLPPDQLQPTKNAVLFLGTLLRAMATNVPVVPRRQVIVDQVVLRVGLPPPENDDVQAYVDTQLAVAEAMLSGNGTSTDTNVAAAIDALFGTLASIVGSTPGTLPSPALIPGNMGRAAAVVRSNIPYFQAEMGAFVARFVPTLTSYQKALCLRDTATIAAAVAEDLIDGRAIQTTRSGNAYFSGGLRVIPSSQLTPTLNAIAYLGTLAKALASSGNPPTTTYQRAVLPITLGPLPGLSASLTVAIQRFRALMDGLANGIQAADPDYVYTAPALSKTVTDATRRIAAVLLANQGDLQRQVTNWVLGQPIGLTLTSTQLAKCTRDVGFIVQAVAKDLQEGGFDRTRYAGKTYYYGTEASATVTPYLPSNQRTPTADALRTLRDAVLALVDAQTNPANLFDTTSATRWESLGTYTHFNHRVDAPLTAIQLDLPYPKLYVAYRLKRTNLAKWRLEARETEWAPWTVVGEETDATPSVTSTALSTTLAESVSAVGGLFEGIARVIQAQGAAFPEEAAQNAGGFTLASSRLLQNVAFLTAETMAWVDAQNLGLSTQARAYCERDVGMLVQAVATDLRVGGFTRSLEAALQYYAGTVSKLVTPNTILPTATAVRRIGTFGASIVRNVAVDPDLQTQTLVAQQFDELNGDEVVTTYGTTAVQAYSSYRLVMLQATDERTTLQLGSIEFIEPQVPDAVADGPAFTNTIVSGFDIVDPGAGYATAPAITVNKGDGSTPLIPALALASLDGSGGLAAVTLLPQIFDKVQALTLVDGGLGYSTAPLVRITRATGDNTGAGATARAWIDRQGSVVALILVDRGSGYTRTPRVTFFGSATVPATATATLTDSTRLQGGRGYEGSATVVVDPPPIGVVGARQAVVQAIMRSDYATMDVPLYDTMTSRNIDELGRLQSVRIVNDGSGYVDAPTISIPPPLSMRPFIVGSPYVQNCTNLSGPWDTSGEKVPVSWPLPWNPSNIYNTPNEDGYDPSKATDTRKGLRIMNNEGSGGGIRIDGRCCANTSPVFSFVCDAFTQINQGGVGFLLTNQAYAQFVSTFGTFCNFHCLAIEGSFANFSNSVTDFGRHGLTARGYYRVPYLSGQVLALPSDWNAAQYDTFGYVPSIGYRSAVAELQFDPTKGAGARGLGYLADTNNPAFPTVTIVPPWGAAGFQTSGFQQTAEATAVIGTDGTLTSLQMKGGKNGRGYKFPPVATIQAPANWPGADTNTLIRANAVSVLKGVSKCRIQITGGMPLRFANNKKPDTLSIVRIHGRFYTVNGAEKVPGLASTYDISFGGSEGSPPYVDLKHGVEFFQPSYISTGGHVFEYVGDQVRGCTYNALPQYGGQPDSTYYIVKEAPAKVFYTSSDHLGNQKIGDFFTVNQATGSVTLDAKNFDLSRISSLGPFLRDGVAQGVVLREVSASESLVASTGAPDGSTVPTQTAVKSYVDTRSVPQSGGTVGAFLRYTGGNPAYKWTQFTVENLPMESRETLGVISAVIRADVIDGLIAEGDAVIYGNLTCDTLVTSKSIAMSLLEANVSASGNVLAANLVATTAAYAPRATFANMVSNTATIGNLVVTGLLTSAQGGGGGFVGSGNIFANAVTSNVLLTSNVLQANLATISTLASNIFQANTSTLTNIVSNTLQANTSTLTSASINTLQANTSTLTSIASNTLQANTGTVSTLSSNVFQANTSTLTSIASNTLQANTATLSSIASNTLQANTATLTSLSGNTLQANTGTISTLSSNVLQANTGTISTLSSNVFQANTATLTTLSGNTLQANTAILSTLASNTLQANTATLSSLSANTLQANTATLTTLSGNTLQANTSTLTSASINTLQANTSTLTSIASNTLQANTGTVSTLSSNVFQANTSTLTSIASNTLQANTATLTSLSSNTLQANASTLTTIASNTLQANTGTISTLASNVLQANTSTLTTATVTGNLTVNGNIIGSFAPFNGNLTASNIIATTAIVAPTYNINTIGLRSGVTLSGGAYAVSKYPFTSTIADRLRVSRTKRQTCLNNTWAVRSLSGTTFAWAAVCTAPELGLVLGIGTAGQCAYSVDGATWTSITIAGTMQLNDVCWSPQLGRFVAVGGTFNSPSNQFWTSTNGIVWTAATAPTSLTWQCVSWSADLGRFVALAGLSNAVTPTLTTGIAVSSDGLSWSSGTATIAAVNGWRSVCWSSELGLFAAVALNGSSSAVMTSPDGLTWTLRTFPTTNLLPSNVIWAAELGLFVVASQTVGAANILTSPDGTTWTLQSTPVQSTVGMGTVCWSPQLGALVALAFSTSTATTAIITSEDGVTWVARTTPSAFQGAASVWSPELGLLVFMSNQTTANAILTAELYDDKPVTVFSNVIPASSRAMAFDLINSNTSIVARVRGGDGTIRVGSLAVGPYTPTLSWASDVGYLGSISQGFSKSWVVQTTSSSAVTYTIDSTDPLPTGVTAPLTVTANGTTYSTTISATGLTGASDGVLTFSIVATNAEGLTARQTFFLQYTAPMSAGQLTSPDSTLTFGTSVAISANGMYMIVGTRNGYAYIYTKSGSTWSFNPSVAVNAKLGLGSIPVTGHEIGTSVAIDATGTRVIVGAPTGFANDGMAFVWLRSPTGIWTLETSMAYTPLPSSSTNRFGSVVSCNTDASLVAVGCGYYWSPSNAASSRSVIYDRTAKWSSLVMGQFTTVAFLGTKTVAVGTPFTSSIGNPSTIGSVDIYTYIPSLTPTVTAGSLQPLLTIANPLAYQFIQMGSWLGFSGDGQRLAVGARGLSNLAVTDTNKGGFLVFSSATNWTTTPTLEYTFVAPGNDNLGYFGSINVDGSRVVVGGMAGTAYVLSRVGTSWTSLALSPVTNLPSAISPFDHYGISVAISGDGNTAVVGAELETVSAVPSAGRVFIFNSTGPGNAFWTAP